jgi:hypothetical protein
MLDLAFWDPSNRRGLSGSFMAHCRRIHFPFSSLFFPVFAGYHIKHMHFFSLFPCFLSVSSSAVCAEVIIALGGVLGGMHTSKARCLVSVIFILDSLGWNGISCGSWGVVVVYIRIERVFNYKIERQTKMCAII